MQAAYTQWIPASRLFAAMQRIRPNGEMNKARVYLLSSKFLAMR